jgi:uncharacterized membrane protein
MTIVLPMIEPRRPNATRRAGAGRLAVGRHCRLPPWHHAVMRTRVRHFWEILNSSYWFVPSVMMAVGAALALAMGALDGRLDAAGARPRWVHGVGPDGARLLLSTLAGSVITVAGVGFSITMVTLTQASTQFGPRLLRNFMRDTGNQLVLGTWVSTFIYAILVLRTVQGGEGRTFVPHASVTGALVLALASIMALVYFIHHVSFSLQAPQVVASVGRELDDVVDRMFPGRIGRGGERPAAERGEPSLPSGFDEDARPVPSPRSGYVQAVDDAILMEVAGAHDLLLRLAVRPGQFVIAGNPLLRAWPPDKAAPGLFGRLQKAFLVGDQSTPEQDVEFAIDQIEEIGLRAMSPGFNDTFTAIHCVDWLAAGLARIAREDLPSPYRYDAKGALRVITPVSTFAGLTDAAFNQIRQIGREKAAVMIRVLEVIATLAGRMRTEEQREALRRHARLTCEEALAALPSAHDRADVEDRYRLAMRALEEQPAGRAAASPPTTTPSAPVEAGRPR